MQEASKVLVGHHDFSSFRAAGCQVVPNLQDTLRILIFFFNPVNVLVLFNIKFLLPILIAVK